jgi:hypothetical protein
MTTTRTTPCLVAALGVLGVTACTNNQPAAEYAGAQPKSSALVTWPQPSEDRPVEATIKVAGDFDGEMARFYGVGGLGTYDQAEGQQPLFKLSEGATLSNVILGHPAADGIHCKGSCTLRNVWWENVGEDAATFRGGTPSDVMLIDGGGASGAKDKVFQSNRQGTVHIKDFYVEYFGKLFRSCGNCSQQSPRHVIFENITAVVGESSKCLAGINTNYGDTAEFRGKNVVYDPGGGSFPICQAWEANNSGAAPKNLGATTDTDSCKNLSSNVVVYAPPASSTESVATKQ